MSEKFLACYAEVFNEDGSQKNCGRNKCIQLIKSAEELAPNVDLGIFGSVETGFLNAEKLKELYILCHENEM